MFPIQFVPDTICSRYNLCRYNLCRYTLCRYNLCRYNLYMNPMFGNQYILVGEGAPCLSWCDAMEADEKGEAGAWARRPREECRKLAQEARQTALKHTHKLPRKLWDDKNEAKKTSHPVKTRTQEAGTCGSTCKERKKLWKEELNCETTLVVAVATLPTVITPSEVAEVTGGVDMCLRGDVSLRVFLSEPSAAGS